MIRQIARRLQVMRAVLLLLWTTTGAGAQTVTIRFFDVGQGDAALITSPSGQTVLIDGGYHSDVAQWMAGMSIDTIDLVVASHNHADHIGGLGDLLQTNVTFRAYMDNGRTAPSKTYQDLVRALMYDSIRVLADTPRIIRLGGITLRVLPMPPVSVDENNASLGILLSYGRFSALFPGDAEVPERRFWEEEAALGPVTVLKVSHHGAANGTDSLWLQTVQPRVAVISVGRNNYKHPSKRTLSLLQHFGIRTLRTDVSGDVTITADTSGAYRISTER